MSRHRRRSAPPTPRAGIRRRLAALATGALLAAPLALPRAAHAQTQAARKETVERGRKMLQQIDADLHKFYFDSTFGGRDMAARYRTADSAILAAPSDAHVYGAIAQYLSELGDSHTVFIPPNRVATVDYGYGARFVGDTCFIVSVKRGSDAEAKGLRPGDALLALDVFRVERPTFSTVQYVYGALSPRSGQRLTVRSPDGAPRVLEVLSKVTMGERVIDLREATSDSWRRMYDEMESGARVNHRVVELGDSAVVWSMASFAYDEEANIDAIMKRVRKRPAVVLDLRNNGGGYLATLDYMLAQFFDRDVKVGVVRSRDGEKPWVARSLSKDPYRGKLIVLVNSGSASSSEIFARVMQLEGRGIVVGDRSTGAVVTARTYPHKVGFGQAVYYMTEISVADVVMQDGKRLEKIGVMPDHLVLPSGHDIAARRDPALARALELAGVTISPAAANALLAESTK